MSEEKEALRKLIMLISDLRAKDAERYEAHVNFMNETIKMIRAIENQMNKHWTSVLDSLKGLNENITTNLDALLTGINPKGLRETSQSLRDIMDTMNKSVQSINLEKVLSELKVLKAGGMVMAPVQTIAVGQQPVPIVSGTGLAPPGLSATEQTAAAEPAEGEWVDPHEKAKKEKEKDNEQHLLKPNKQCFIAFKGIPA